MSTETLSDDTCESLEKIIADSKKSADGLRWLLDYARAHVAGLPKVDLSAIVTETVNSLANLQRYEGSLKLLKADSSIQLNADEAQLIELVTILAAEMFRDSNERTKLNISLCSTEDSSKVTPTASWMDGVSGARLTFARSGVGAPVEIEDGILELPTGEAPPPQIMALLRAKGIVRQHRGQIKIAESVDDSGQLLTMEIFLPVQG
jgi:hypothetical protein